MKKYVGCITYWKSVFRSVKKKFFSGNKVSSWKATQLAYRWELQEAEHEHDRHGGESTFDFIHGSTAYSLLKLTLFVIFLGIIIGCFGSIFFYTEHILHYYFVELETKWSDGGVYTYFHWLVGATLSAGLVGYITTVFIPECAGTGVDATKICMAVSAPIPARVAFFRTILTSIYIAFGNPLGIEAAILHVSAAIASSLLRIAAQVLPEDFRSDHLPTWVLVGMTTGLSAAFGAPLAGMIYAIEEYMNIRKIGLSTVFIGIASTVGVYVSQGIRAQLDSPLNVTKKELEKNVLRVEFTTGVGSLLSFVMPFLCALLALIMSKITLRLRKFNSTVVYKYIPFRYQGIFSGAIVGLIGIAVFGISGSRGVWGTGDSAYDDLLMLPLCTEEDVGLRRIIIKSAENEELFYLKQTPSTRILGGAPPPSSGDDDHAEDIPFVFPTDGRECQPFSKMLVFVIGKVLAVCVAVSFGGPGGLFFPALLIGGTFGGVVGSLFQMMDPSHALDYHVAIMLGMAGFFAALHRTPLTAILISYQRSGYGRIGLSIGLTYSMITTSVLAHLLAEGMDSTSLVSHMMLQDGIDVMELFKKGLGALEEEDTSDEQKKEEHENNQEKARIGQSKSKKELAEEKEAAVTTMLRPGRIQKGGGPTMRRREMAASSEMGRQQAKQRANRRGTTFLEKIQNISRIETGQTPIQYYSKSNGAENNSNDSPEPTKQEDVNVEAKHTKPDSGVISKKEKSAAVSTIGTSAAHKILLSAAKRALLDQRIADNLWLHLLAKRSNVIGMHEHLRAASVLDMYSTNPSTGKTILAALIINKLPNAVRLLLFRHCDPNYSSVSDDRSPLLLACEYGLNEAATSLIAYGADQSVVDTKTGNRPLHLAAESGNGHLARTLIRCNASLQDQNNNGETPVIVAGRNGHQSVIRILAAESWREQRDGEHYDFIRKYVLLLEFSQSAEKRKTRSASASDDANASQVEVSTEEPSSTGKSSTGKLDIGIPDQKTGIGLLESFDPQASNTLSWGEENKRIVALTEESFTQRLTQNGIDLSQLEDLPVGMLWTLHKSLRALYYVSHNMLCRHLNIIEVKLQVTMHSTRYILMEHQMIGRRYMNMIVSLNDTTAWEKSARACICHNLGVNALWINENLSFVDNDTFTEEISRSNMPQLRTTYHVNSCTFDIIDPKAPGCIDQIFIGLPAMEPFCLDGKIWRWIPYENTDSSFDWGIL